MRPRTPQWATRRSALGRAGLVVTAGAAVVGGTAAPLRGGRLGALRAAGETAEAEVVAGGAAEAEGVAFLTPTRRAWGCCKRSDDDSWEEALASLHVIFVCDSEVWRRGFSVRESMLSVMLS